MTTAICPCGDEVTVGLVPLPPDVPIDLPRGTLPTVEDYRPARWVPHPFTAADPDRDSLFDSWAIEGETARAVFLREAHTHPGPLYRSHLIDCTARGKARTHPWPTPSEAS